MLAVSFFTVIFSSLLWLIYAIRFIKDSLAGISFFDAGIANILLYALLVCAPIFLIWSVFGYINQYFNNKNVNIQLRKLMSQMKKNQDYSDLLARVLIESEGHLKDGFVLSKFDLLIADMNELLSETIRNCKIASAEQIENLWNRVQNGGKWAFGKVLIEVNNSQPNFKKKVFEKASFDNILAGTIMEFCARYQAVVKMLEKHDSDKIFLNMIENGVMGKVFSILAPVSDELRRNREVSQLFEDEAPAPKPMKKPIKKPSLQPEPVDNPSFYDEEISEDDSQPSIKKSFFSKLTAFRPQKNKNSTASAFPQDRDPFSLALEKSFGNDDDAPSLSEEPLLAPAGSDDINDFQLPTMEEPSATLPEKNISSEIMTDTQKTLDNLKKEWAEMDNRNTSPFVQETNIEKKDDLDEENFAYPFGGWTDEKNYQKRS